MGIPFETILRFDIPTTTGASWRLTTLPGVVIVTKVVTTVSVYSGAIYKKFLDIAGCTHLGIQPRGVLREIHDGLDLIIGIVSLVLTHHLTYIHQIAFFTLLHLHLDKTLECNSRVFTYKEFCTI